MRTDLSTPGTERAPLITRRVKFSDYLWFAVVLLVMVTVRVLETQSP